MSKLRWKIRLLINPIDNSDSLNLKQLGLVLNIRKPERLLTADQGLKLEL